MMRTTIDVVTPLTLMCAVIAAVPPTMMAWAALRQARVNKRSADVIIEKTIEIHNMTNGNLTRVLKELEEAQAKIARLERLLSNFGSESE